MSYHMELLLLMYCITKGKDAIDEAHAAGIKLIADEI